MAGGTVAKFNIKVVGVSGLQRRFRGASKRIQQAIKATLFQEAERMMTISKQQVPVDTGNLRASGHVTLPFESGGQVFVELGYGGPAGAGAHGGQSNAQSVGYALTVHEDLQMQHRQGTKAKYLEDPVKENIPHLKQAVNAAVKQAAKHS